MNIKFDQPLEIDKAYMVPAHRHNSRSGPRPIICKLLRLHHTEAIFAAARKTQNLQWNGSKIILTQDYSKTTVDTRKGFLALRDTLRKRNILFSFVGPTKFRITDKTGAHVFDDPEELRRHLYGPTPTDMEVTQMGVPKRCTSPEVLGALGGIP